MLVVFKRICVTILCVLKACNLKYFGQDASTDVQQEFLSSPIEVSETLLLQFQFGVCSCMHCACVCPASSGP